MLKSVKTLEGFALVAGCAFLLSACGDDSGNDQPQPAPVAITAHVNGVPASVYADSTIKATVSLSAAGNSGATANVQWVDVGTVTPQIDCGQPQTLTIGGESGTFSCLMPQVNLGSSNTHQLQVDVNDSPNLSAPISIDVVNGGRVRAQLTSAAGTVIQAAKVGQTVYVSFNATTKRTEVGQYTVTAPDGWSVGDGGVCNISAQSASCRVAITVPANATPSFYGLELDAAQGSSLLSPFLLPLSVEARGATSSSQSVGSRVLADNPGFAEISRPLPAYVAQNISKTLYAGSEFTYKPVYIFKNTSNKTLAIASVTVSGLTNVTYGCNVKELSKNADYTLGLQAACSLEPSGLYVVSGLLAKKTAGTLPLRISIKNGSKKVLQDLRTTVTLVPYVPDHLAVRVVNKSHPTTPVWFAVNYGGQMVDFSGSGGQASPFIGATTPGKKGESTTHFKHYQKKLPASGLFYIPHGVSGDMRLTYQQGGFQTDSVPSVSASITAPSFLLMEMTYFADEQIYIDQSYVNALGVMASFNVIGSSAPLGLSTQSTVHGIGAVFLNLPESRQQLFDAMEKQFNQQHSNVWHYVPDRGVQNYVREEQGKITNILAPISVAGITISDAGKSYHLDPMRGQHYYRNYIDLLWTYLEKTPVFVNANFAQTMKDKKPLPILHCIVKGVVETAGPHKGQLVFTRSSSEGTCPTSKGVPGSNTVTQQAPLVFAPFEACDFLQAAGSSTCNVSDDGQQTGLYGTDGSYRAAVGEVLAAYQAAGLLPFCAHPTQAMSKSHAQSIMTDKKGFKNPTCLLPSSAAPVWNVYAKVLSDYSNVYAYSYGDFLGLDGTVVFTPAALNSTLKQDLNGVAQPVTITVE